MTHRTIISRLLRRLGAGWMLVLCLLLVMIAAGCGESTTAAGMTDAENRGHSGVSEAPPALSDQAETASATSVAPAAPAATAASTASPTTTSTEPLLTSTTTTVAPSPPPPGRPIIAWQPSHQDDTGSDDWHEYIVCGDIALRARDLLPSMTHVVAWEIDMGLTGSNNFGGTNRAAFDSELAIANAADADYFISVHVDGAAPSGILGMFFAGDKASAAYVDAVAGAIAEAMDLPYRGIRGAELYSLDPFRNKAPIRILLELGDNVSDRELLESPDGRARMARALADAVAAHSPLID